MPIQCGGLEMWTLTRIEDGSAQFQKERMGIVDCLAGESAGAILVSGRPRYIGLVEINLRLTARDLKLPVHGHPGDLGQLHQFT